MINHQSLTPTWRNQSSREKQSDGALLEMMTSWSR